MCRADDNIGYSDNLTREETNGVKETCPECNGDGGWDDIGCCGYGLPDGSCCGNGIRVATQCECCQGTGFVMIFKNDE